MIHHRSSNVLEHESSQDRLDAVRRSFAALRKLGKV
jgi:hypothetical protein